MDSATLTKFLDFVSFDVRHVPGSKKNFEKFQNITRRQRGDPSKTETRAESAPPQPTTSFQNPAQIGLMVFNQFMNYLTALDYSLGQEVAVSQQLIGQKVAKTLNAVF